MTATIHFCDWSSQPDLHIVCDDSWATPAWGGRSTTETDLVYRADDERLYTFEVSLVTCEGCRAKHQAARRA